jgi:hypothetical protein
MARKTLTRSLALFVTALLAATISPAAFAAPPAVAGFTLTMSPYARVLDALQEFGESSPEFMMISKEEAWDNPHIRTRARNKPALMVFNDDETVDAELTSFSLTINEGPYFFGMGDFVTDNFMDFIQNTIYTDPGVTITGSSVSADMQTLNVTFDGLTAGKKAIFNIDLDTSDATAFPFPDYRVVLCGATTSSVDTPNLPATIAATFTSTTMGPPNNTTTLEMDLPVDEQQLTIFDQFIRLAKEMEMLEIKEKEVFIPEPNGLLLAVVGGAMAVASRRRRRAA